MTAEGTGSATRRFLLSPGLLALLACCLIVVQVYFTRGCDPLAFVLIGERFALHNPSGSKGYDGQFAYYIAMDPTGAVAHLDDASFRYQRILYPLLARLLSLGQPALIPWTLLLLNVVSISMSTEVLSRMLGSKGLSPYLALLLPLWMGQIFALRAGLYEPLCFLFIVVALWWYEQDRHLLSATALTASVLTKEVGFLFLPAVVLVMLLQKRWWPAFCYALAVLLPYAALQVWLYLWLGDSGLVGERSRFEMIPFHGFTFTEPLPARIFLVFFFAIPIAALSILAVRQLLRTPRSVYAWAMLANSLFIVYLPRTTTIDVLAVFRVATGTVVAALLFCAAHRRRRFALLLIAIWLPPSVLAVVIPGFLLG